MMETDQPLLFVTLFSQSQPKTHDNRRGLELQTVQKMIQASDLGLKSEVYLSKSVTFT